MKALAKNAQAKTVNYGNGVSIDTDDVIYIEKGPDFHSYTFNIKRDNTLADAPVENLLLSLLEDGSYQELLITYHLTEQEKQKLINGGFVDTTGKVTVTELAQGAYNNGGSLAKSNMSCEWIEEPFYGVCSSNEHFNGEASVSQGGPCKADVPSQLYIAVIHRCVALPADTSLGENGEGGGGGPQNGPGGLSGNNPEETITTANVPFPLKNFTPCLQLKIMNENTNIKAKITELRDNIGDTNEKGILIRDIAGNETSDIIIGPDNGDIIYPYYENSYGPFLNQTYGTAHNHLSNNPNHIGIFTPDDILQLYVNGFIENHNLGAPKKAITFVITDKGYFALKITDLEKLRVFVNWYGIEKKNETQEYINFVNNFLGIDKYNINPSSTHDQQIIGFLRLMKDKNIGVELYEGDKNTFGDWKKLELVDNGNGNYGYNPIPCNL